MSKIHVKTSQGRLDSWCQSLRSLGSNLVSSNDIPIGVRMGFDVRLVTWMKDFHIVARFSVEVQKKESSAWDTFVRFLLRTLTQSTSQDCRRRSPP